MFRTLAISAVTTMILASMILPNAGFDGKTQCAAWSSYSEGLPRAGSVHTDLGQHYDGICSTFFATSGEVMMNTEAGGIESMSVPVIAGHTYQITMMFKGSSTDNAYFKFGPVFYAIAGNAANWRYRTFSNIAAPDWTPVTITALAPPGATSMAVRLYNYNTDQTWAAIWVDAASIQEVASAND